uniref:DNA-directed RNA polymerase III subunit RPC8-like isoform X1 n=1 Tax=Rhizophora mucronata TaxID=61149 RepID=A0A2P2L9E3_RHIMU
METQSPNFVITLTTKGPKIKCHFQSLLWITRLGKIKDIIEGDLVQENILQLFLDSLLKSKAKKMRRQPQLVFY